MDLCGHAQCRQGSCVKSPPCANIIPAFPITAVFPDLGDRAVIARLNMLCCPDAENETDRHLATLDEWAERIRSETARNFHRYMETPAEYGSESQWRLAMMRTIVGLDFKVGYDARLSSSGGQSFSNNEFFADPRPIFLQGALGPSRSGTCASLPVLYVALGRRVGYPLHLVSAKEHLFVRWDDGKGTRFNMEASNSAGFTSYPDETYRKWPKPITPDEEKRGLLRNLTSRECLAIFLANRAICLSGKRGADAMLAASQAFKLAPPFPGIAESMEVALAPVFPRTPIPLFSTRPASRNDFINTAEPRDPMESTRRNIFPASPLIPSNPVLTPAR